MYEGIMHEAGKRVSDEDAFSYACQRVENGTTEEQAEFMEIARTSDSFGEMQGRLVEWFYSGEWVRGY